jgi:hypothetical protein
MDSDLNLEFGMDSIHDIMRMRVITAISYVITISLKISRVVPFSPSNLFIHNSVECEEIVEG